MPERTKELTHKQINLTRALREIRRRGVATSEDVITATGLGTSQAGKLIHALGDAGIVSIADQPRVGRRDAITLRGEAGRVVGIDMTMSQIAVSVADLEYGLLGDRPKTIDVPIESWQDTLDVIASVVARQLAQASGVDGLLGVGLGLPGPVQRGTGIPESDHLLPGWKGVPVAAELHARLATKGVATRVAVANDASVGALGVHTRAVWGNPTSAPEDVVYVRITHGIGMGIIAKGRLMTGSAGYAGEIGHVRVQAEGPVCTRCERKGCLEVLASEKAVLDALRQYNQHEGRQGPRAVEEILSANDARTRDEVGKAGWHVGFVFAAVANVLNPAWIVLGGPLSELPTFRKMFDGALHHYALPQAVASLRTPTWRTLFGHGFPRDRDRDLGSALGAEMLGAMAYAVDEFADDFLSPRVLEVDY